MNINKYADFFVILLLIFIIDLIYILIFVKNYYIYMINDINNNSIININFISYILIYFLLASGLYYFIIKDNKTEYDAFILGIIIYGVYDMTNYTILNKYKLSYAIIDSLWGGILFFSTIFIRNYLIK